MKIAFLSPEYVTECNWDGGLASYLKRMTAGLREAGHRVTVFVISDKSGMLIDDGVEVRRMKVSPKVLYLLDKATLGIFPNTIRSIFAAFITRFYLGRTTMDYDLVQCATGLPLCLFLDEKTVKAPVVIRISSIYSDWLRSYGRSERLDDKLFAFLERCAVSKCAAAFCPSRLMQKKAEAYFGRKVDRLLPPGFSEPMVNLVPARNDYFMFFGTLGTLKGMVFLGGVLHELLLNNPSLSFVFAGKDYGIEGKSAIEYLKQKAGANSHRLVFFPPLKKEELLPLLAGALAVVLPSANDNLPNACIEAMGMGKIVIGTYEGGFDEMVENGKSGFIVRYGDRTGLMAALSAVVAMDAQTRSVMGETAKNAISALLDPASRIRENLAYYKALSKK